MGTVTFSFKKHHGPIPADDIAPQIITDCGNLRLDFKQLGLWASQPFLETLGHWFLNEIQNLLSSEKRTLDYWAAVQFFFSLALRRLWQLLPIPWHVWFLEVPREVHPNSWINFAWQASQGCSSLSWLCIFFLHTFFLLNILLTYLDTALCFFLAMNVCGWFYLWRGSINVFWTTVRSAVFPMIV